jgi:hypothetical protein
MRRIFDRCFWKEDVQGEGLIFHQMSQYLTVSEADSSNQRARMQRARGLTQKHNSVSKRLHNLPVSRQNAICRKKGPHSTGKTGGKAAQSSLGEPQVLTPSDVFHTTICTFRSGLTPPISRADAHPGTIGEPSPHNKVGRNRKKHIAQRTVRYTRIGPLWLRDLFHQRRHYHRYSRVIVQVPALCSGSNISRTGEGNARRS